MQRQHQSQITRLAFAAAVALLTINGTSQAAEQTYNSGSQRVNLIELFTSQGCSSCPPAESWLGSYKTDPRLWKEVVPVAFHVTYWDYLGWRDRFGDDAFSQRQSRYRNNGNIRSVYTPGLVVNGKEWRGWFRGQEVPLSQQTAGELKVTVSDRQLRAEYMDSKAVDGLQLNVAILGVDIETNVEAGENSGRRLPQDFVVLHHEILRSNNGVWETNLMPPELTGVRHALAAWVASPDNQAPLQATGGWIKF